jgi:hypothetical protein
MQMLLKEDKNKVRARVTTWFGYVSIRLHVKHFKVYIVMIFVIFYNRMICFLYRLYSYKYLLNHT